MAKLNKTQVSLLTQAVASKHGWVGTSFGNYTGRKKSGFGSREFDAACQLCDAGLLSLVSTSNHYEPVGHFNSVHWTESLWQITDAGRATLAATTAAN